MSNLKYVTLKRLKAIQSNNYYSKDLVLKYDKELVDFEINRKTKRPEHRYIRKDRGNFNKIHDTIALPYKSKGL